LRQQNFAGPNLGNPVKILERLFKIVAAHHIGDDAQYFEDGNAIGGTKIRPRELLFGDRYSLFWFQFGIVLKGFGQLVSNRDRFLSDCGRAQA